MMPTSTTSWTVHNLGVERLFALQGPSTVDTALVDFCRPFMVLAAFFTQKPSIMSEPSWRNLTPQQSLNKNMLAIQYPATYPGVSFFMGILADLPALYLQCDQCIRIVKVEPFGPSPADVATIWTKARRLRFKLQKWKSNWSRDENNKAYESSLHRHVKLSKTDWLSQNPVKGSDIFETMLTLAYFYCTVILLTSIPLSLLQAGLRNTEFCPQSALECDYTASSRTALSDIEKSIQGILRGSTHYLELPHPAQPPADFYLLFPLRIARRASIQFFKSSELVELDAAIAGMQSIHPKGIWAKMDFGGRFSGHHAGLFG